MMNRWEKPFLQTQATCSPSLYVWAVQWAERLKLDATKLLDVYVPPHMLELALSGQFSIIGDEKISWRWRGFQVERLVS